MWNLSDEHQFFSCLHYRSLLYPFQSCIIWLYAVPSLVPSSLTHVEPHTTPYILPCTHIALTGNQCVFVQSNFAVSSFLTLSGRTICPMSFWGSFIYHQWPRFFVNLILFSQEVYTVWWLWLLRDFTISANPSVEIWWDKLTNCHIW